MTVDQDLAGLDPIVLLEREAARLDRFFLGLTDDEWNRPSACVGWSVRDVLGHLAGSEEYNGACLRDEVGGLFARFAERGISDVHGFNAAGVEDRRGRPTGDVLDEWRRGVAATRKGLAALGQGTVPTSVGPYPARWQAFHLAAELATHSDDVSAPVAPEEEPDRTAWRARVARFMLREARPDIDVDAIGLDDAALVRVTNGRARPGDCDDEDLAARLQLMP